MAQAYGLIKCPNYIAICNNNSKVDFLYTFRSVLLTKIDIIGYGETERDALDMLERIIENKRNRKLLSGGKLYAHIYKTINEETGRYKYKISYVTSTKKDTCYFVKHTLC